MKKSFFLVIFFALVLLQPAYGDDKRVIVRLKNGNSMSATLVTEDSGRVTVNWEGSEITLEKNEIAQIVRKQTGTKDEIALTDPKSSAAASSYKNNPVLRLTNSQILDVEIIAVDSDAIWIKNDLGDGDFAELAIPRKKLEYLEFKPIHNKESGHLEDSLRKPFGKRMFYELGMITLITDTEGSSLKTLKQTLQDQQTILYLEFFDLLKGKTPAIQHFVVVFDRMADYFEYAASDGVPAWLCPGYFSPTEKTLFLMNYFGDQLSDLVYQTITEGRKILDAQENAIKSQISEHYHTQLQGLAKDAKIRVEGAFGYMQGLMREQTLTTLRHELTHEFLHNWGVQNIQVSKIAGDNEALMKKKKKLFETSDLNKKKELVLEIIGKRKKEAENLNFEASNSWFVEGLAEYASTSAIGEENADRLYALKEAKKNNALWPIEQLTVYKMGSFPGVSTEAILSAYAQSWSLVEFLMKNYRKPFLSYLDRMAKEAAKKDEDVRWLLEAIGKDSKTLEKEWHAYIDTLKNVEDPSLDQFMRVREILYHS